MYFIERKLVVGFNGCLQTSIIENDDRLIKHVYSANAMSYDVI